MIERLYKKVVFAGTFDHLHEGHKYLLRTALKLGEFLAVGLTTDELLKHKKNREKIQPYQERYHALYEFLQSESKGTAYEIFPIDSKEGGADTMIDLEALVVSDEISVVNNAFAINEMRAMNGLPRYHIIVIPRVRSEDDRPLSSSRIREGEDFDGMDFKI
ncbi:MAG: pantetheine-phosphate adenylyltransferase [Candidatus Thorarchaeota archaeon]